jgi:hypothetical protein
MEEPCKDGNPAILGGALYRNGKHKEAIAELTAALQLPDDMGAHLCAKHFLALTHHALGDTDQAAYWRLKSVFPADAPWPVPIIDRLLRREVDAELSEAKK